MKKNVLSVTAVLALFAAIFLFGLACLQCFIAYQVQNTGVFHGMEFDLHITLYEAAASVAAAFALFFLSLWLARLAVKAKYVDQHPRSTIRRRSAP